MTPRIASLAIGLLSTTAASAAEFDLAADFSVDNGNPNGVWSYGQLDTLSSPFTPWVLGGVSGAPYAPSVEWHSSDPGDGNPTVWHNRTSQEHFGNPPGSVALHPGSGGQGAVVRWTTPAGDVSVSYSISAVFGAGDSGSMGLAVLFNGATVWSGTDSGSFSATQALSAGDRFDFVVHNGYWSGTTPLSVRISTVSAVPEPSALALAAFAGLGSVVLWRRRRG
jgi:hypothetical protein